MIDDLVAKDNTTRDLNQYVQSGVPGLQYIAVTADRVLFEYAGGWADIEGQKAMTLDTTLMAYSMTKTFTAVAILQLAEQRKLSMMFPGIPVHIHDSYIAGQGILRGAVLGLIPVVNMADTPELARGELMRFFAEAAWYPTALLPSQGVRWEALDESSAKATITDDKIALTLTFSFSDEGVINTVHAKSRERVVDGKTVVAPWLGRFWSYALRDGMLVPTQGEVAWLLAQGQKPYWRGTTTSISFEFANPS